MDDNMSDKLKELCPTVAKIVEKTIGADLAAVTPDEDAGEKREAQLAESKKGLREPGEHEHLAQVYSIKDDAWKYEIQENALKIDSSKDWRAALTAGDWSILGEHDVTPEIIESDIKEHGYEVGLSDWKNVLIIRTPHHTWMNLCGREWHYDIDSKEFKLYSMS